MLDLNLSVVAASPEAYSASDSAEKLLESSGSFNSEDSSFDGYSFGILKPRSDDCYGDGDGDDRRTMELFPVTGAARQPSRKQWLGLACLEGSSSTHGGAAEQRIAPQQVKKSRRGPRSRSSQYRGVTFYRRTGRWESHIWLAKSPLTNFASNAFFQFSDWLLYLYIYMCKFL